MRRSASFGPEALQELREAANHYALESPALRQRFIGALEAVLLQLQSHPESGAVVRGEFRRLLLRGFPYSIIYAIRQDETRIYAVMHHHRRPYYWSRRR